jgi:hypothetical protein
VLDVIITLLSYEKHNGDEWMQICMTPSNHWVSEPEGSRQSGYGEEIISGPTNSGIQDVQTIGY